MGKLRFLTLTEEEMKLLEQASATGAKVRINDAEHALKPFFIEKDTFHNDCGACPDELAIDTVKGKPCLFASHDRSQGCWEVSTVAPIMWGIGYKGTHLDVLEVQGIRIGKP